MGGLNILEEMASIQSMVIYQNAIVETNIGSKS